MDDFQKKFSEAERWFTKNAEGMEYYAKVYDIFDEFRNYYFLIKEIPESDSILKLNIEDKLIEPLTTFVDALGPTLNIDRNNITFTGATAASGSSMVLKEIQTYTPKANDWLPKFQHQAFTMVEKNQQRKDIINEISKTLHNLYESIGIEFDELVEIHRRYQGTIDYASSFGIKMRNVLEHFKGLCNKCAVISILGHYEELNDTLTWNKISEAVAINGRGSKYDNQFSKLSSVFVDIWKSLSKDAKDYTVDDIEKLPNTFIKTIQYLNSAIKLIDLVKIKSVL